MSSFAWSKRMLANLSSKRFRRLCASSDVSIGQSPDCRIRASRWARLSGTRRPTYQTKMGRLGLVAVDQTGERGMNHGMIGVFMK
jgi:hypothetical protein